MTSPPIIVELAQLAPVSFQSDNAKCLCQDTRHCNFRNDNWKADPATIVMPEQTIIDIYIL
jgi:hypothetical protein